MTVTIQAASAVNKPALLSQLDIYASMAELVGALQLAVNQCPVHDHRHRLGFVDVITTNFKYVLVQEHQVSLFAHLDRSQFVGPAQIVALIRVYRPGRADQGLI